MATANLQKTALPDWRMSIVPVLQRQGALIALIMLLTYAGLRFNGFLSWHNIAEALRFNAMYGLISLGMTFVIMTGGIDLSVGYTAALCSVVCAEMSPHGLAAAIVVPILAGAAVGLLNGWLTACLNIAPFVATLGTLMAARGLALILAPEGSISLDTDCGSMQVWTSNIAGVPSPVWVLLSIFAVGSLVLNYTRFGRHILAIGGGEDAARLMGLPVTRIKILVYVLSGALAGLAGVFLAFHTITGTSMEGVGWELTAIASVVVGGTLLTGGEGSVWSTFFGFLLMAFILNMLNFMNIDYYWQAVIRGVILMVVVVAQNTLSAKQVERSA